MEAEDAKNYIHLREFLTAIISHERERADLRIDAAIKHVDERLISERERTDQRTSNAERAINKAENAVELRLQGLNEFRATVEDLVAEKISRGEFNARYESLISRFESGQKEHASKINSLERNLYILLGGLAAVQFLFTYLVK